MGYIFIIFSLYNILGDYNVLLGILFLHRSIGLLTQLSYLTYVGYLNSFQSEAWHILQIL
jgi:hypothetical protein